VISEIISARFVGYFDSDFSSNPDSSDQRSKPPISDISNKFTGDSKKITSNRLVCSLTTSVCRCVSVNGVKCNFTSATACSTVGTVALVPKLSASWRSMSCVASYRVALKTSKRQIFKVSMSHSLLRLRTLEFTYTTLRKGEKR